MNIYFCSGYKDLTDDEFQKHYIPQFFRIQNTPSKFILSDENDFDVKCLEYLLTNDVPPENIIIHSTNETLSSLFKSIINGKSIVFIGNFYSRRERDAFSTSSSTDDILWLREIQDIPNFDPHYTSRTYLNYLRRLKKKTLEMFI